MHDELKGAGLGAKMRNMYVCNLLNADDAVLVSNSIINMQAEFFVVNVSK